MKRNWKILAAGIADQPATVELARLLWPENEPEELQAEITGWFDRKDTLVLLAKTPDGAAVAFAMCRLRQDYVAGTSASPAGYLEGIYVRPEFRRQGLARTLLAAGERWALERGCSEFGSDCYLDNMESFRFHLASGFAEQSRIICFAKKIDGADLGIRQSAAEPLKE